MTHAPGGSWRRSPLCRGVRMLAGACTLLGAAAVAAQEQSATQDSRAAAAALLESARDAMIAPAPPGPMTLEYALELPDRRTGSFRWVVVGPGEWAQELTVGRVTVSRGVAPSGPWQSSDEMLVDVWWLVDSLLDCRSQVRLDDGEEVLASTDRVIRNVTLAEISIGRPGGASRRVAFVDTTVATLAGSLTQVIRREYAAWKRVEGSGLIPGAARLFLGTSRALAMTLTAGSTARVEDGTTTRPASALSWAHCDQGSEPVVVSTVAPAYPEQARKDRAAGVVVVQARIGKEGNITGLRVIRAPDVREADARLLSDAAIRAVSQWRFEPARCDGGAIEAEYVTAIQFTLE